VQQALLRAGLHGSELRMRIYSSEELDLMAEAYNRLHSRVESISSPDISLRLVEEIGHGIANGERDEDTLADAALERANLAI
jgi:hypothetical protein